MFVFHHHDLFLFFFLQKYFFYCKQPKTERSVPFFTLPTAISVVCTYRENKFWKVVEGKFSNSDSCDFHFLDSISKPFFFQWIQKTLLYLKKVIHSHNLPFWFLASIFFHRFCWLHLHSDSLRHYCASPKTEHTSIKTSYLISSKVPYLVFYSRV